MEDCNITWYVIEDNIPTPYEKYYIGSYSKSSTMSINLQVWNNKFGQKDVKDLKNIKLELFFDTVEDSVLLDYCKIKIDNGESLNLTRSGKKSYIYLQRNLSGKTNNGSSENRDNYINVTLEFGPIDENMKKGLKNLYLDIVEN